MSSFNSKTKHLPSQLTILVIPQRPTSEYSESIKVEILFSHLHLISVQDGICLTRRIYIGLASSLQYSQLEMSNIEKRFFGSTSALRKSPFHDDDAFFHSFLPTCYDLNLNAMLRKVKLDTLRKIQFWKANRCCQKKFLFFFCEHSRITILNSYFLVNTCK